MESKPWYTSKTAWLNLATLLSLALMLPEVGQLVPPSAARYITALNALLNLALRLNGNQSVPLSFRKPPAAPLIALLLTGALLMPACASAPATRQQTTYRLALVSESYAVALQRLQAWEIGQFQAGAVGAADHVVWQRRIERLALAGKAANDAIRASQLADVQLQARAIIAIMDELVSEQVIRFPEAQRVTATVIMESLKTAVMIWSATMSVDQLGPPALFDRVRITAEAA